MTQTSNTLLQSWLFRTVQKGMLDLSSRCSFYLNGNRTNPSCCFESSRLRGKTRQFICHEDMSTQSSARKTKQILLDSF